MYLGAGLAWLAVAMNFSESFKLSGLLCRFSPDGKYLVSRGALGVEPKRGRATCAGGRGGSKGGGKGARAGRLGVGTAGRGNSGRT